MRFNVVFPGTPTTARPPHLHTGLELAVVDIHHHSVVLSADVCSFAGIELATEQPIELDIDVKGVFPESEKVASHEVRIASEDEDDRDPTEEELATLRKVAAPSECFCRYTRRFSRPDPALMS